MILPDTSIWIEFFKARTSIFPLLRKKIELNQVLGLSPVFGELFQGAKNKREITILSQYWENILKIDERNLWIDAGRYSQKHWLPSKGVGLIDATLLVVGERRGARIWTLDKKLLGTIPRNLRFTDPSS